MVGTTGQDSDQRPPGPKPGALGSLSEGSLIQKVKLLPRLGPVRVQGREPLAGRSGAAPREEQSPEEAKRVSGDGLGSAQRNPGDWPFVRGDQASRPRPTTILQQLTIFPALAGSPHGQMPVANRRSQAQAVTLVFVV